MFGLLKAYWNSPYQHYPTAFAIELPNGSRWQNGYRIRRAVALETLAEVQRTHPAAKLVAIK